MGSEVFFTQNPADYDQLEGLYITERTPVAAIQGVTLGTTGMAGRCVRGPSAPQEITNPGRFVEVFGERDFGGGGPLIGEVWKALLNKKFGKLVVRRVIASDAVLATKNLSNAVPTVIARIDATSKGQWGNNVTAAIEDASDGVANHWNARINYLGKEVVYENCDTTTGNDNLAATVGSDIANPVTISKVADGRPVNGAAANLASGAEGTLAAADYAAGITDIANYQGVSVCIVPEAGPVQATLNGTLVTLAQSVTDRLFLTWSGVVGSPVSTEKTARSTQITTGSDRLWWCFNAGFTEDPQTSAMISQGSHVWLASVLSQTDVDVHPGAHETMGLLAGLDHTANDALVRQDLADLRAAGITTLERLKDGFLFRSVVTTSPLKALREGTRRRMVDFLQLSAADEIRFFNKAKNNRATRAQEVGLLIAFCKQLQAAGRVIDDDSEDAGPAFDVDNSTVNSTQSRGTGRENILWRVRLVGHQLFIVLSTEMATGLTIERAAA